MDSKNLILIKSDPEPRLPLLQAFLVAFTKTMERHPKSMRYTFQGVEVVTEFNGRLIGLNIRDMGPAPKGGEPA